MARSEAAQEFLILFANKKKAVWFFAATKNLGVLALSTKGMIDPTSLQIPYFPL